MSSDQLTLVLLGAFWAGTSAIFNGMKNTSEVRDKILLGKIEKEEISASHLWRLLILDWLPLKLSIASISLVLGIIIVMLPTLADLGQRRAVFPPFVMLRHWYRFSDLSSFL